MKQFWIGFAAAVTGMVVSAALMGAFIWWWLGQ